MQWGQPRHVRILRQTGPGAQPTAGRDAALRSPGVSGAAAVRSRRRPGVGRVGDESRGVVSTTSSSRPVRAVHRWTPHRYRRWHAAPTSTPVTATAPSPCPRRLSAHPVHRAGVRRQQGSDRVPRRRERRLERHRLGRGHAVASCHAEPLPAGGGVAPARGPDPHRPTTTARTTSRGGSAGVRRVERVQQETCPVVSDAVTRTSR